MKIFTNISSASIGHTRWPEKRTLACFAARREVSVLWYNLAETQDNSYIGAYSVIYKEYGEPETLQPVPDRRTGDPQHRFR
jgi:hypothetical protein